jgi:hypothetical protein
MEKRLEEERRRWMGAWGEEVRSPFLFSGSIANSIC